MLALQQVVVCNSAGCCQAPDSSSRLSTGNLVFTRINLKPAALKNFVFAVFPSLRSLPFSEFGRFGITNQTYPKSRKNNLK